MTPRFKLSVHLQQYQLGHSKANPDEVNYSVQPFEACQSENDHPR